MKDLTERLSRIMKALEEARRFVAAGSSNSCERLTGVIDAALSDASSIDPRWHDEEIERLRRLIHGSLEIQNRLFGEKVAAEREADGLREVLEAIRTASAPDSDAYRMAAGALDREEASTPNAP